MADRLRRACRTRPMSRRLADRLTITNPRCEGAMDDEADGDDVARETDLIQAFVDEFGSMPFANLRR
jgi:hypothetical protein